jgi:hypothetical protein
MSILVSNYHRLVVTVTCDRLMLFIVTNQLRCALTRCCRVAVCSL